MEVGKRGAAGAARSAQRREMRKGCATSATKEHTTGNYSVCTLCTDRSRPGNGHVRGGEQRCTLFDGLDTKTALEHLDPLWTCSLKVDEGGNMPWDPPGSCCNCVEPPKNAHQADAHQRGTGFTVAHRTALNLPLTVDR
eukprot:gene7694-biopygen1524